MVSLLPATATVIGIVVLAQIPSALEVAGVALVIAGVALHREPRARVARLRRVRHAVAIDEGEHPPPGVGRGVGVLLVAAVEEAVRRALVDHDLVLDAGVAQRRARSAATSSAGIAWSAPPISARIGALHLGRALRSARRAVALGPGAVEADRAGEPVAAGRGEPGVGRRSRSRR